MLNRRRFVHHLGAGVAGGLAVLGREPRVHGFESQAKMPIPSGAIRIGGNENPYGPAPTVIAAATAAVVDGHRYDFAASDTLVAAIAAAQGVPAARVLLSGGSGDVLRAALKAFAGKARPLVTGAPSYDQPVRQAEQAGIPVRDVPLTSDLRLDLEAMLAQSAGAGLVYICNPNNPTSTAVPVKDVMAFVAAAAKAAPETTVLVDEAYFEYADDPSYGTVIPAIAQYSRLIVARTFSKIYGMAGMRVGYGVAQEAALRTLRECHSASGMSVMSVKAGIAALKDGAAVSRNQALNRDVRAFTMRAFEQAGYRVAASQANFVLVDVRRDVKGFIDACEKRGVLIGRPFPPLTTWARITIGTRQEMEKAMPVFMDVLASPPLAVAWAAEASPANGWTC
jgi:histidinol-phosphate aminotransferase